MLITTVPPSASKDSAGQTAAAQRKPLEPTVQAQAKLPPTTATLDSVQHPMHEGSGVPTRSHGRVKAHCNTPGRTAASQHAVIAGSTLSANT